MTFRNCASVNFRRSCSRSQLCIACALFRSCEKLAPEHAPNPLAGSFYPSRQAERRRGHWSPKEVTCAIAARSFDSAAFASRLLAPSLSIITSAATPPVGEVHRFVKWCPVRERGSISTPTSELHPSIVIVPRRKSLERGERRSNPILCTVNSCSPPPSL